MAIHPIVLMHHLSKMLSAVMAPLGVWGVGGLALLDSAAIPIPGSMDGILIKYVNDNPHLLLVYCAVAAIAGSLGSLVPFYVGRAGGELFLLKRIDRKRYERIRDKFERQEFLAVMIPSLGPPPTPLKIFQFAAGVFEMRPIPFVLATCAGKFVQFTICTSLYLWLGPKLFRSTAALFHQHLGVVIGCAMAALLLLVFFFVRKMFDRRRGEKLPSEEAET